ncbi:MAG: flippase-like domain-containing protein [Chitinophagaceae bacterium]|nr:flippase-like domain-containing protein [Chitinophagaceae bacterium]
MKLTRRQRIFINYFLGPLLFLWLSWSVYRQIERQPNLTEAWLRIKKSLDSHAVVMLFLLVLLMLKNWALETLKWKIAIRPVQQISFWNAFQAVLSGVAFSVTTPNRMGEYLGRMIYMNEGNRLKIISLTVLCSLSQLIITVISGFIGLLILRNTLEEKQLITPLWMLVILTGTGIALCVLLLFYFQMPWLIKRIDQLPAMRKIAYLTEAIERFSFVTLVKILIFSFFRFLVFIVQYWICFWLFDVNLSFTQTLFTVSVSFFVLAIIPTIAVAELAQRGKVITAIAGLYSENLLGLTFTTVAIWFINLILPAITGSLLILRFRKIVAQTEET